MTAISTQLFDSRICRERDNCRLEWRDHDGGPWRPGELVGLPANAWTGYTLCVEKRGLICVSRENLRNLPEQPPDHPAAVVLRIDRRDHESLSKKLDGLASCMVYRTDYRYGAGPEPDCVCIEVPLPPASAMPWGQRVRVADLEHLALLATHPTTL